MSAKNSEDKSVVHGADATQDQSKAVGGVTETANKKNKNPITKNSLNSENEKNANESGKTPPTNDVKNKNRNTRTEEETLLEYEKHLEQVNKKISQLVSDVALLHENNRNLTQEMMATCAKDSPQSEIRRLKEQLAEVKRQHEAALKENEMMKYEHRLAIDSLKIQQYNELRSFITQYTVLVLLSGTFLVFLSVKFLL